MGSTPGITSGEVIDKDMIAVSVSGDLRTLPFVGSAVVLRAPGNAEHTRGPHPLECRNWHPTSTRAISLVVYRKRPGFFGGVRGACASQPRCDDSAFRCRGGWLTVAFRNHVKGVPGSGER
jgi:hypothetical protein